MKNNLMQNDGGEENGMLETVNRNGQNTCNDTVAKRWKQGMTNKYCCKCKKVKPVTDFFKRKLPRTDYLGQCKKCRLDVQKIWQKTQEGRQKSNEWSRNFRRKNPHRVKVWQKKTQLKASYNMILEEFIAKRERQKNQCKICNKPFEELKFVCVDHDHDTGKVRDLLCRQCNSGLGYFHDNPMFLSNAAHYLQQWNKSKV